MPALRQYLLVFRRRRVPIVLTILIVLLAAVAYSLHKAKLYQATAQVVINQQDLASALTGTPDPASSANDFTAIVQTQADVARTPSLAQNVARAVPAARLTYRDILGQTSVTPVANANILVFSATEGRPQLAVQITNAYADAFVAYTVKLDTASLNLALSQTQTRISQLRKQGNIAVASQLVTKAQQLQELAALQTSSALVTGQALDAVQTAPKPAEYIALGLIGGIALAIGLAAVLEVLDTRVRSAEEIEERLGVVRLGHIPPPPRKLRGSLLMLSDPHSADAETFRLLWGNLQFMTLDRRIETLMVTSAVAGEGKSTTIANLAVTAARAGSRVVLVDLDLRRPALHRLFSLPPGPGITDVAVGRAGLADALFRVELPGARTRTDNGERGDAQGELHVLRAGVTPPDPAEFVASPSVSRLLEEVAALADVVFIDSPPLLGTSDAMGLCRVVDGVFVVARLPLVQRPMIDEMRRALTGARAAALGFVLTGKRNIDAYGQPYGYGYASGYGPTAPRSAATAPGAPRA